MTNAPQTNPEAGYWIALSRIDGLGPLNFARLVDYFGSLKNAWDANSADLAAAGIKDKLAKEIIACKNNADPDEELRLLERHDIGVILSIDNHYPPLLRETYSQPPLLFWRGCFDALRSDCLAIVGARKNSHYGQQAIDRLMPELVASGLTIVSGLALGTDAYAHQSCLKNSGRTIAALGSGVDPDSVFPRANFRLGEEITSAGGLLLSEYAPGTQPNKQSFPLRNRIISGLSLGTLVIEAGESSGSLITAKYAVEQNRDVFAVPGSIFSSSSAGTNALIKQGAKPVTVADDILEEFKLTKIIPAAAGDNPAEATAEESLVLRQLSHEPLHVDKISQLCRIKINVLSGLLIMMEMKGWVKDAGGRNYVRN